MKSSSFNILDYPRHPDLSVAQLVYFSKVDINVFLHRHSETVASWQINDTQTNLL